MAGNNAHPADDPRNPHVHHEPGDVNAIALTKFGLSMAALIVIFMFGLWSCRVGLVERLNITLDDEQAEKLARLADRMHIQPGTIARSLLSVAIDDADPDARNVAELLDGIPGALARAELGRTQAAAGETISLDEL